jgi:tetratricopeptide (TPR) repeat protein
VAEEGMSLQDIIKRRQRADFVGRDERLTEFGANLRLPPGDLDRKFLFNIHGVAGVGKTFLTEQFRRVAERAGVVCAYADESSFDVLATMSALAADLAGQDRALTGFDKRLATYRERRHELEADPGAPGGGFITRSAVRVGLAAAREVPLLGMAADTVDAAAAAEQVDRLRAYLSKKFRSSDDVRLLLSPAEVLTKVFLADLDKLAERHPVALFFDTFERTAPYLEGWLLDVLTGKHGSVRANVLITIAGQRALDSNRWSPFRGLVADVPLEPFTEAEARELLAARGVRDEETVQSILALSGRLPVWLATLAESTARDEVADPSDSAVERFLKWEPDDERRAVALSGALPRRLNEDVLAVVGRSDLFDWLRQLPFVTEAAGHWRYHDVARAPMLRLYRNRSPQRWREQHRRLHEYYAGERDALGLSTKEQWGDGTWQDLILETCYHRLCADPAAELPKALEYALLALDESTTMARRWAGAIVAAGRDCGADQVQEWGQRLADTVPNDDSDDIAFLTALIEDGKLAPTALKVAYQHRGRAQRAAERHELALADYESALRLDPDHADSLAGRGETYRLLGQHENALASLDRAINLDPDKWTITSRGQTYLAMGRHDDAIADLTRVIELDPNYRWAITYRGLVHVRALRYDDALADFNRAIELDASSDWAIALRGDTYRRMGRHDDAIADLNRAIEIDPNYDWALCCRGETFLAMGRHDDAIADLNRAIEIDPEYRWAILTRAQAYRDAQRFDEAVADYTRAIALSPDEESPTWLRADTYRQMGRYEEALVHFNRAIELAPDEPWLLAYRGETYREMGRNEEALADFNRAIEFEPDDGWSIGSRGETYLAMGRFDDAIADLNRAAELNPTYRWVLTARANAYRRTDRNEAAVADLTRAIELDENHWTLNLRGRTFAEMGLFDDAIADFTRAFELKPEYDSAVANRGGAYLELGRHDEAIADFDRAIEIDQADSWNRYLRGAALLSAGQLDRAMADFRSAVELGRREANDEPAEPRARFNLAVYFAALGDWAEATRLVQDTLDRDATPVSIADLLDDLANLAALPGVDGKRIEELLVVAREAQVHPSV